MKGFLSLEPDAATRARLVVVQDRLRDGLTRQGVHFPDRLGPTLLAWPFGSEEEIDEAAGLLGGFVLPSLRLERLGGRPNDDRPAEIGYSIAGLALIQEELFHRLRSILDPDPPRPAFVRLVRVSPPSRKVGAALRGLGTSEASEFTASDIGLWTQTPTGFELKRKAPLDRP